MTSKASTETPSERSGGNLIANLLGIGAFLYALGLVVANLYLMRFGAADFTLLRPRAIVTGALLVLPAFFTLVVPLFMFNRPARRRSEGRLGRLRSALEVLSDWGGEITFQVLPVAYYAIVVGLNQESVPPRLFGGAADVLLTGVFLWMSGALTAFLGVIVVAVLVDREDALYSALGQPKRARRGSPLKTVVVLSIGLLFFGGVHLWLFIPNVYPSVPRQIGGARPQIVSLAIASDSMDSLSSAGVSFASVPPTEQNGGKGHATVRLKLLEAGESYYLIQLPSGTVIQVASSAVEAVVFAAPQ